VLRPVQNVRLRLSTCPREPVQVVKAPTGPLRGPLSISTATLANERLGCITLTASATRTTNYGPVERGKLTQRSVWKFTRARAALTNVQWYGPLVTS
jgi:hypothetical protein